MLSPIDRSVQFASRYRIAPVPGTDGIADLIPAPGEISEEGTLWNRRTAQLLQADRRIYPVSASQTISAGDVVDVQADGCVGKTLVGQANVKTKYVNDTTSLTAVCALNEDQSILASAEPTFSYARVFSATGELGKTAQIYGAGTLSSLSLARLSDTQFVVGYSYGSLCHLKIGTVSGAGISFGTQQDVGATGDIPIVRLSENSFFCPFNTGGHLGSDVYIVSGSSISAPGTGPNLGTVTPSNISATHLPDDSSGNKRVCVCFSDSGDGNKGKAVIATISSANVVTWGTVVTFNDVSTSYIDCCAQDNGNVVVACTSAASPQSEGKIFHLTVSGASVSAGESLTYFPYTPSYNQIVNVGGSIVVTHNYNAFVLQILPSGLQKGEDFNFNQSFAGNYASSAAISSSQLILAYADAGNSNYGTATILEVFGGQVAGSFEDRSAQAIALQSAASGQDCEVIFDGVAELPGLTAGKEIASPGVYGYCPMDGWVWVMPEWGPKVKIAYGSYAGTGQYGNGATSRNKLNFEFEPKVILIVIDAGTGSVFGNVFIRGQNLSAGIGMYSTSGGLEIRLSWNGNTVEWYSSSNANSQLNLSNTTYRFAAFG